MQEPYWLYYTSNSQTQVDYLGNFRKKPQSPGQTWNLFNQIPWGLNPDISIKKNNPSADSNMQPNLRFCVLNTQPLR